MSRRPPAPPRRRAFRARLALVSCAFALVAAACRAPDGASAWRDDFARRLPALGHRNVVVVADAAYPEQTGPGITTRYTGEPQLAVLDAVLAAVDAAPHVAARVWLDAELAAVPEAEAPGVEAYRAALAARLAGRPVERVEHARLLARLAETSERFSVLVLKTDLTVPYTSVFVELDCGYWGAGQERLLRDALGR